MGLRDETLVMFTSDHGEMLGEHGMWIKRTCFDPALKVPLVVSWPGRCAEGVRRDEVVSLVDVGPTLVRLASQCHGVKSVTEPAGRWCITLAPGNDCCDATTRLSIEVAASLARTVR